MASSMVPLCSLGQDNQIEAQDDFFGYVMQLALASNDSNGTDASISTSTSTAGHIISLNNHFNIKNTMVT